MQLCVFARLHVIPAALSILCAGIVVELFQCLGFTKYLQCHDDRDIFKKTVYVLSFRILALWERNQGRII